MIDQSMQIVGQRRVHASGLAGIAAAGILLLVWGIAAALVSASSFSWTRYDILRIALVSGATLALCCIPGMALLQLCWADAPLTWVERLGLAWGLGAGLPPLLLMAVHLIGLPWAVWATPAYVIVSGLVVLWLLFRRSIGGRQQAAEHSDNLNRQGAARWIPSAPNSKLIYNVVLLGLTLLALFARLFTIRDLFVGPYVDSYHQTMIAQLLVEHRGLFTSWEPYAPLSTFTYHYGFHSILAFVHDLTGLPVWQLEPLVGQVLAAGVVPLLGILTFRLTASRSAGLWAAVLVGFVNAQPAYYAIWGRYTSMTSHSILIALLVCWIVSIESARMRPGLMFLSVLCCAALAYTHYQTTLVAVIYISIYMSILVLRAPNVRAALPEVGRAALIAVLALIIAAPWLLNTISGELDRNVVYNSDRQSTTAFAGFLMPKITPFFLHQLVLPLAIIGLIIGTRLRRWRIVMLGVWAMASMLVAFPYAFGLPGTGVLDPSFMALTLYLCMLPLAAYPIGLLQEALTGQNQALPAAASIGERQVEPEQELRLSQHNTARSKPWRSMIHRFFQALFALSIVGISVWGLQWQRDIVPIGHRMVTASDMQAFEWIRNNTPADARFLVQSHPLYEGTMIVGTDAGWWIPLMTGRQTNVPPMTYGSEQSIPADWGTTINKLAVRIRRSSLADMRALGINLSLPEVQTILRQAQLRYIYIGAQPIQGDKSFGPVDRIDVDKLRNNPDFRLVYDQGGVLIYEMVDNQ